MQVRIETVDVGEAAAGPGDRRGAAAVALLLALFCTAMIPVASHSMGESYPVFAIVIALSIAAIAITALLLWAQARVASSVPLAVLAAGYGLTAATMFPYMLFYRGLWPQLSALVSADPQTAAWLWVEWHLSFELATIAYYIARTHRPSAVAGNLETAERQRRIVIVTVAILLLTVPPLIWIDHLPTLSVPTLAVNGHVTPLFAAISTLLLAGAIGAIVVNYRTNGFRSLLDLWLAVANVSMCADITITHFSHQFSAGWYASRVDIFVAAGVVLAVLLFQTAKIYGQLAVTAERLREESLTDALTGLANRRSFEQHFGEVLRECARDLRPVAVLMIDIDQFKLYNDAFGHLSGDACLRTIAQILERNIGRTRDMVARIGGEEMAVVMPNADAAGAAIVAERMRAAVRAAEIAHGNAAAYPVVTISIGVAATRDPARATIEQLVLAADKALYRAKWAGRDRVVESLEPVLSISLPDA